MVHIFLKVFRRFFISYISSLVYYLQSCCCSQISILVYISFIFIFQMVFCWILFRYLHIYIENKEEDFWMKKNLNLYFNRIYVFYEIYLFTEFLFFFKIYLLTELFFLFSYISSSFRWLCPRYLISRLIVQLVKHLPSVIIQFIFAFSYLSFLDEKE